MQLAFKCISLHNNVVCVFLFSPFELAVCAIFMSTPTYVMSQQSLHERVSTDPMKRGGEMGGKIAHFASPGMQFPSSIHISLKAI